MINAYHIVDAVPSAFFAIVALWAAGSRRHWFVRTAVVGVFLLVMLFIPAYEIVIQFGVEVLLIMTGIALWRRRRLRESLATNSQATPAARLRPQVSLEAMLLVTAVVAVVTAVMARAPSLSAYTWTFFICGGISAVAVALASVWLVFGRARWWLRLLAAPLLVVSLAAMMRWLPASCQFFEYWLFQSTSWQSAWQSAFRQGLFFGVSDAAKSVALGVLTLCAWMLLVTRAGWFDPFRDAGANGPTRSPPKGQPAARRAAVAMFALVSFVPLYLLYRLLTPSPIPDLAAPRPNGYDELLAAGRSTDDVAPNFFVGATGPTATQLLQVLSSHAAAVAKAHAALSGDCRFPLMIPSEKHFYSSPDLIDLLGVHNLLMARSMLATSSGPADERIAANLDLLRLSFAEARASGTAEFPTFVPKERHALCSLWQCIPSLSSDQCLQLAKDLQTLDAKRMPWSDRAAMQLVIEENIDWKRHLASMVERWSGHWPSANDLYVYKLRQMEMRALVVELAVQVFKSKNGRLPTAWPELVPEYLAKVPGDPFNNDQPLDYQLSGNTYQLWSTEPSGAPRSDLNAKTLLSVPALPTPVAPSTPAPADDETEK